jgi:tRNA pseudouridine55 synthase
VDGLLVIDKPAGPTSHDVVARMRRILREPAIGHTGTLDPMATGVLPLVVGRATRLARFLSAGDKIYEAAILLGIATDTGDAQGTSIGSSHEGPFPAREEIAYALDAFRGAFLQAPPAYSAKKIGGTRSYKLARAAAAATAQPPSPAPRAASVPVSVYALDLLAVEGQQVMVRVHCSAGFYVRSLAHDLGTALGTGAHLSALRRTHSGEWTLADALPLEAADRDPALAAQHVIPLARMLTHLPSVALTADGVRRAAHGRDIGAADSSSAAGTRGSVPASPWVRLLDPEGNLVAIAEPAATAGLLHPSVVLM